jgi:large subunit ribosomal protein L5
MSNPMKAIRIAKLTLNMGTGKDEDKLKKAIKLMGGLAGTKIVHCMTTKKIPGWGVRPGLALGCKTTLRGPKAKELLKRLLGAKENGLKKDCFDNNGNVSFGIDEYINIPDMKYDPTIGMMGLQASVTLNRAGFRIKLRRLFPKTIPTRHKISQKEAMEFMKSEFGIAVGDAE